MEKLDGRRCLQKIIGSCGGCEVQLIAIEKIRRSPRGTESSIIDRISRDLCPSETNMQTPERSEQKIW